MKSTLLLLCLTSSLFANPVLDFWFRDPSIWFEGSDKVDQEISERFSEHHERARYGQLSYWKETPKGRLALIILLDQFSRHLYRESPEAFACDALALSLVLEGLEIGDDLVLEPEERAFFYMPLQHAENLQIQRLSVEKYEELATIYPEASNFFFYAERHKEIIERFGHFPHRNPILGRPFTEEEVAFLEEPYSSF